MGCLFLLVNNMKSQNELINEILAEWNPIGVPVGLSKAEYENYIPLIKSSMNSEKELINCLKDILINKMELDYNDSNPLHKEELKEIALKIINIKD